MACSKRLRVAILLSGWGVAGMISLSAAAVSAGITTTTPHPADEPDTPRAVAPAGDESSSSEPRPEPPKIDTIILRIDVPVGLPRFESAPSTGMFLINVEGYRDQTYVHGEMTYIGRSDLEGYIYTRDGKQIYLYGHEERGGVISAYDRRGNHYVLRPMQE